MLRLRRPDRARSGQMSRLQLSGGEGAGREVSRNPPADGPRRSRVGPRPTWAGRRSRCSAPRFSRLSAAWSCWCMPGATRRCWPSGFSWLRWHASTRHWPFLSGKAPLALSIAGFLLAWLCLGGLPGLVIVGAMALSLWFAVQYVRITNRVGLLERKIAELKKCTEHSI